MLNKMEQQNRIVREQVKSQLNEAGVAMSEEEDGVSIGNEYHVHAPGSNGSKNNWALPLAIVLAGGLTAAGLYFGLQGDGPIDPGIGEVIQDLGFGEPENFTPEPAPD